MFGEFCMANRRRRLLKLLQNNTAFCKSDLWLLTIPFLKESIDFCDSENVDLNEYASKFLLSLQKCISLELEKELVNISYKSNFLIIF